MPDILIFSFSVTTSFLLGILSIYYIKVNRSGNIWFGIFLISLAFAILGKVIWREGLNDQYPYIMPISEMFRFIIAPSLYLSIWYYTQLSSSKKLVEIILHLLPAILFISFVSIPYLFSGLTFISLMSETTRSILAIFMKTIIPLQVIVYWFLSFQLLNRHVRTMKLFDSEIKEKDLSWMKQILFGVLALILFFIFETQHIVFLNFVSPYFYLFFILFTGYHLLKQQEIFLDKGNNTALKMVIDINDESTVHSTNERLHHDELIKYKNQLDRLLVEEEIYTDPNLNLAKLSERIGISMNDLSFLINKEYQMNFYALINQYRVEKVKQLIAQDQYKHITLLGIAFEAGFTSKSTFNHVFKKNTGLTPTAYIKNNS